MVGRIPHQYNSPYGPVIPANQQAMGGYRAGQGSHMPDVNQPQYSPMLTSQQQAMDGRGASAGLAPGMPMPGGVPHQYSAYDQVPPAAPQAMGGYGVNHYGPAPGMPMPVMPQMAWHLAGQVPQYPSYAHMLPPVGPQAMGNPGASHGIPVSGPPIASGILAQSYTSPAHVQTLATQQQVMGSHNAGQTPITIAATPAPFPRPPTPLPPVLRDHPAATTTTPAPPSPNTAPRPSTPLSLTRENFPDPSPGPCLQDFFRIMPRPTPPPSPLVDPSAPRHRANQQRRLQAQRPANIWSSHAHRHGIKRVRRIERPMERAVVAPLRPAAAEEEMLPSAFVEGQGFSGIGERLFAELEVEKGWEELFGEV